MGWYDTIFGGDDPSIYGWTPWNQTTKAIPPGMVAPNQGGMPMRGPKSAIGSPPVPPSPDIYSGAPDQIPGAMPNTAGFWDWLGTPTKTESNAFRSMFGPGTTVRITPENTLPSRNTPPETAGVMPYTAEQYRALPDSGYAYSPGDEIPRASVATVPPGTPSAPPAANPPPPTAAAAPAASPSAPTGLLGAPSSPPLAGSPLFNQSVNFGPNSQLWQTLGSIGSGMVTAPGHSTFTQALGAGLAAGNKTAGDFPMRQLQQALGQAQVGQLTMTMQMRQQMLGMAERMKDPQARAALIAAANDPTGRTAAALFSPSNKVTIDMEKGTLVPNEVLRKAEAGQEEDKADIKVTGEKLGKLSEMSYEAGKLIDIVAQAKALLPAVTGQVGFGSAEQASLRALAAKVGVQTDDNTTPFEIMRKLLTQVQVLYAKTNFPTRVTNNDLKVAEMANPNLDMRAPSISQALDIVATEAQKARKYADEAHAFAAKNGYRLNPPGQPSFTEYWSSKSQPAEPPPVTAAPVQTEKAQPATKPAEPPRGAMTRPDGAVYSPKTKKYYKRVPGGWEEQ